VFNQFRGSEWKLGLEKLVSNSHDLRVFEVFDSCPHPGNGSRPSAVVNLDEKVCVLPGLETNNFSGFFPFPPRHENHLPGREM
jgi:hypothetical protein